MVDCEFEGVAGYVENERATRCQQEMKDGRKLYSLQKLHNNGLITDLGLCPHCFFHRSSLFPKLLQQIS